jgi:hypothetical protein
MLRRLELLILLVGVGALASGCTAFSTAQSPFSPDRLNQGWWSSEGEPHSSENDNYGVGQIGRAPGLLVRNFFTFDLSGACEANVVVLRLTRFDQPEGVTYQLVDVTTPADELNGSGPGVAIYDDLGTGTAYGSFDVFPGSEDDVLSFRLNEAGVAAYNAARGGFFSIGGSLLNPIENNILFGASGERPSVQQLLVACAQPASQ